MYLENVENLDAITLLSDELFLELFRIDNELLFIDKKQALEDRAKELKKTTQFRERLNFYLKEKKNDEKRRKDEETAQRRKERMEDQPSYTSDFTGAPEFKTGKWQATDNGIYTIGEHGVTQACRHPIYISMLMKNADTDEYNAEITFRRSGSFQWDKKIVPMETLSKAPKITRLSAYGINVTDNTARYLVDYMSTLKELNSGKGGNIEEKTSSSHLGWVGSGDKVVFMPYESDIEFDAGVAFKSLYESVAEPGGTSEAWYKLARELRKTNRVEILMCLAASLASVLVEICGGLPFVVDFWGGSGKGKTVALMLAASVWGNPTEGAYLSSARSTAAAEEIRLGVLNSLPMMIDDISQIKNSVPDIGNIIYQWCSGMSKSRSNQELTLNKVNSWRNCIITNAEQSLVTDTMQGGAINRIIDVEIGDTNIFANGQDVANRVRENYGWLGRDFIKLIREVGFDEIRKMVERNKKEFQDMARLKNQVKEEKQVIPMAMICVADELIESHIFQDGIRLGALDCLDMMKDVNQTSENRRAYNLLWETIAGSAGRFPSSDRAEEAPNAEAQENRWFTEIWGLCNADGSCDIIGKEFERILKEAGYQGKAFLSWAIRNGVVQPDKQGNPKMQRKVNGKNIRCVHLLMDEELLA